MKNNNILRWKRTALGVSAGLLLMCNTSFAQVPDEGSTFTLNLKNTDIQSLIATVSKQTGRNFVVDPRVKAKVTVISTDPVNADDLYEVFLSVLQVHGYAAVPAGDLIKIVPDVTAKQGPVPILGDGGAAADQLVTQVITVVNVPAAQLVPILRPMVPQQGHLAAYAATNSLIITDRASNIDRLMEIIRRIDRPDNEEIEVVRLNHASAAEIVRTLSSLQGNNIGGPQGPGAMQLVADERTNSVLISGDTAVRVRVRGLIAHLDTPIETGGNTRVVYLKFANAEDIVTILQGVSQGQARVGATTTDGPAGGTPNRQTFTPPTPQNGQQPANNGVAANNQNNNSVTARSASETGESNVDIQADPGTNSLIITAPQDELQNILAVIRQLDIRRAQVLVEAVIAEITEDNTREFGINFLLDGSDKDVPIGFSNLGGGTDSVLGIAGALSAGTAPASLGAGLSLALGRFDTGEIDFGFLVRAIASDADNNILSTPSILTLDNEEAEIIVGQNVPFVTGTQLSANNDNPFQTIERQDIGLTLRVTPQINDGNTIRMNLEQEVSNIVPTATTGAADIITSLRSIRTTVLVEDGQTIVLGGLIDDQFSDVEERVPLLGDIPFFGRLFRFQTTTKNKRNLMIFLHPVILRDSETADQYSNSKYNSLRSQQSLLRQEKKGSVRKEKGTLPKLKLFFQGQEVDGPLTRLELPELDSTTSPERLAAASTSGSIIVGDGTLNTSASSPISEIAAVATETELDRSTAALVEEQPATVAESAVVAPASVAPTEDVALNTEAELADVEVKAALPVANEALVTSVLQAKPIEDEVVQAIAVDTSVTPQADLTETAVIVTEPAPQAEPVEATVVAAEPVPQAEPVEATVVVAEPVPQADLIKATVVVAEPAPQAELIEATVVVAEPVPQAELVEATDVVAEPVPQAELVEATVVVAEPDPRPAPPALVSFEETIGKRPRVPEDESQQSGVIEREPVFANVISGDKVAEGTTTTDVLIDTDDTDPLAEDIASPADIAAPTTDKGDDQTTEQALDDLSDNRPEVFLLRQ